MFDRPKSGERAILVHVELPQEGDKEDLQEFQELAVSAGAVPVAIVTASRKAPDSKFFVGSGKAPQPLRQDAVNRLLGLAEEVAETEPKEEIPFMVGQVVEITEGPFSDFSGTVEEILGDKGKVRVSVSLFGRPTVVELDYLQLRGH